MTDGLWKSWDVCSTRLWSGNCPGCVDAVFLQTVAKKILMCSNEFTEQFVKIVCIQSSQLSWVEWNFIEVTKYTLNQMQVTQL